MIPFEADLQLSLVFGGASLVAQMVKNLPEMWKIWFNPGSGRSPGEANGNTLQYPCLENSTERGVWWSRVHTVARSWIKLNDQHFDTWFLVVKE